MNSRTTIGRLRLAASNTRRPSRPHWPPDRCCSISSASEPIDSAEAEQEADQPGAEELIRVQHGAGGAGQQADDAHYQRALLKARERRHVGDHCVCLHLPFAVTIRLPPLIRSVPARMPAPAAGAAGASLVGSPPGTSAAAAFWLSCRARM